MKHKSINMDSTLKVPLTKRKRKHLIDYPHDSHDSDSEDETRQITGHWARWLVVKATDPQLPLSGLSPFAISKGLKGMAGEPKSVKRLYSGDLLVEMQQQKHSELLQKTKILVDRPVSVTPHRSLNSSKGVIRTREFRMLTEAELKTELAPAGVTHVHRVTIRKGDSRLPTDTYFLTFDRPTLPLDIKAGYERIRVTPYVPSPIRCFKCQKFGHVKDRCSGAETCGKCSQPSHEGLCTSPAKCANCDAAHPSFSKTCPIWVKESAIQALKAEKSLRTLTLKSFTMNVKGFHFNNALSRL